MLTRYNDQVQGAVPRVDKWLFRITGTEAATTVPPNSCSLITFGALTQAQIDAFFGSTNEILEAAYDETAMGVFTTGMLFNYGGQVKKLLSVDAICFSGTGGSRRDQYTCLPSTALTASTIATECVLTSLGNVGVKIDWTEWVDDDPGPAENIDLLTSGIIEVRINYLPK